jgi:hypothetical protein
MRKLKGRKENTAPPLLAVRALPRNGFTCHNIYFSLKTQNITEVDVVKIWDESIVELSVGFNFNVVCVFVCVSLFYPGREAVTTPPS